MNILLINISLRPDSLVKMFPIGLAYIATAIKMAGFNFDLLDIDAERPSEEEITKVICQKEYEVICFGCIVTGYRYVKELTSKIRNIHPRACIVAGNTVASSIPRLLLERTEVDVAVMGEGDETIVDFLTAFRDKRPLSSVQGICYWDNGFHRNQDRPVLNDLDSLPIIDYSFFDIETYIRNENDALIAKGTPPEVEVRKMYVNTARGCIGNCTFCYHAFQGKKYRKRSTQSILKEIGIIIKKYNLNKIALSDELSFYNKTQALEFAEAVIESGLKFSWGCQCRATLFDKEDDLYIIEKQKEAGCTQAFYSLESADPVILSEMRKNITVEQFTRQTQLFHKAGLSVNTSLVFGYPQETPETIARTFDVCIENGIYPSIGYLLPQPGSVIYEYARSQGYIPDEDDYLMNIGDRQDLYLNLTRMSDDEFVGEILKGAKRCNEALGRGINEENLIKTGGYKNAK